MSNLLARRSRKHAVATSLSGPNGDFEWRVLRCIATDQVELCIASPHSIWAVAAVVADACAGVANLVELFEISSDPDTR